MSDQPELTPEQCQALAKSWAERVAADAFRVVGFPPVPSLEPLPPAIEPGYTVRIRNHPHITRDMILRDSGPSLLHAGCTALEKGAPDPAAEDSASR